MNLFAIDNEILTSCVDTESGEIIDEEYLNQLEMERDIKIGNIACWIKNLEADAKAYKEQKTIFAEKQKAAETKKEKLKEYLASYLGGQKWDNDPEKRVKISFRKSEQVEVDESALDDIWFKMEPKVDKAGIKEALKGGFEIEGAQLVTKDNIQIK